MKTTTSLDTLGFSWFDIDNNDNTQKHINTKQSRIVEREREKKNK